jgi:hypothetical protein
MCLTKRIQEIQAQKAALDAQLLQFEQLESKTQPVTEMLGELIEDYRAIAPEELDSLWHEVLAIGQKFNLAVQPLKADELRQREVANVEIEMLRAELNKTKNQYLDLLETSSNRVQQVLLENQNLNEALAELRLLSQAMNDRDKTSIDQSDPEQSMTQITTAEEYLRSKGFFQPEDLTHYDDEEKYETYRGWDIYYSVPNGGIVAIGLYDSECNQPWDVDTEYIQEVDLTFPESLADFNEIVAWTRSLIDRVESFKAPGQLALEFPEPSDTENQGTGEQQQSLSESDSWNPDEFREAEYKTDGNGQLNFLEVNELPGPDDFDSIKDYQDAYQEWDAEQEESPVDIDTEACTEPQEEELQQFPGTWPVHVERILADKVKKNEGEAPDPDDYEDAEVFQRAYLEWEADRKKNHVTDARIEIFKGTVTLKHNISVEITPSMHTKCNRTELAGATFKFLNSGAEFYSTPQTPEELNRLGDDPETIALALLERWQKREEGKKAPPAGTTHAESRQDDEFTEFVKVSNEVGYIKRKDNGQILSEYLAFSNKLPDGKPTNTKAKTRSQKWAEWLQGTFQLECEKPRAPKRMVSGNGKQPFAYEIKVKGLSLGQLTKLTEEDFSLLPGEMEEKQQNQELLRSELKTVAEEKETWGDGMSKEEYFKAVDEELSRDDDNDAPLLNEDEIELIEMAKSAIESQDSEAVKSVNSVFKEVCASGNASREKVWNALTEAQQQTYKLLLQMEFAKAPDFSDQTPEYIVYSDGKMRANVWISLRTIDGKATRVWRYKGQVDDIRYTTKEAAAIAAIQQQAG